MPDFTDPRAAADRIRTAVLSLTSPNDLEVVRQYLHELEDIARQQDAEGEDGRAETDGSGTVVPLRPWHIPGSIRKASPYEAHRCKWVLSFDTA